MSAIVHPTAVAVVVGNQAVKTGMREATTTDVGTTTDLVATHLLAGTATLEATATAEIVTAGTATTTTVLEAAPDPPRATVATTITAGASPARPRRMNGLVQSLTSLAATAMTFRTSKSFFSKSLPTNSSHGFSTPSPKRASRLLSCSSTPDSLARRSSHDWLRRVCTASSISTCRLIITEGFP